MNKEQITEAIYDTWIPADFKHFDSYAMERAMLCADAVWALIEQAPTCEVYPSTPGGTFWMRPDPVPGTTVTHSSFSLRFTDPPDLADGTYALVRLEQP
jgi:hypothetical protein